jgi:hypothetical protein
MIVQTMLREFRLRFRLEFPKSELVKGSKSAVSANQKAAAPLIL